MKKFIALFIFSVYLFVGVAYAQCPEISVTGPAGIVPPDGTAKFSVEVKRVEGDQPLTYLWRVSYGTIISGQGTSSIEVKGEGVGLPTASVEIGGVPENCPNTFSDSSFGDPTPTPFKVGVWKRGDAFGPLQQFQADMAINPYDQGYIFIARGDRLTQDSLTELRRAVLRFSPREQNGESSRITFIDTEGPRELVEIWRVPPRARNPECESCRKPQCPELFTSGPTGPPILGKPVKFSLTLKGEEPADLRFVWSTNTGQILDGQGTKAINVMPPWEKEWNLHITVEVVGLPPGCPAVAVESVMPGDPPHPVLIDEFGITPVSHDSQRLGVAIEEIKNRPTDTLFIVLYHPKSESPFRVQETLRKLTEFFSSKSELGRDYFSIVSSPSDDFLLRIYRIPPGGRQTDSVIQI